MPAKPQRVGKPRESHKAGGRGGPARFSGSPWPGGSNLDRLGRSMHDPFKRAVIIDVFRGQIDPDVDFDDWSSQLHERMVEVLGLLDRGDEASVSKAKHRVNEMVTFRLASLKSGDASQQFMAPIELDIEQIERPRPRTRLKIDGADTPAFLYALSTALSLNGLSIERVRIDRGTDGNVADEIDVADIQGRPLTDKAAQERVRLSVLLTKQFTYFLDHSPNPFTALTRFEKLTEDILSLPEKGEWLDLLANPRAMQNLAKLLGASDYLWEDFIRQQYESILPIFKPYLGSRDRIYPPRETVPLRMQEALEGAVGLAEQQDRLNKFKDRETFLIDLDHILTPGSDFRQLSERLTFLAENLVATAARLVFNDLVKSHGEPQDDEGKPCRYAVFGLGKLGGVALGYASDIELLFLYESSGKTAGGKRKPISNTEFYLQMTQEASRFIRTKREGIFEVDLRLRPYGEEGPLASSLKHFADYYGPEGPAHPFERLALVRMRWVAGDPALGYRVETMRDEFLYDGPQLDTDELWSLAAKQRQQKIRPGQVNAKYSHGGLTDLESTVQMLQLRHARSAPQLRTPELRTALYALGRAGILDAGEFANLVGAYHFHRRLINALRMLRGSAQDLFLPPADSDELRHLARRMGYEARQGQDTDEQLLAEFQRRTADVRAFVEKHFESGDRSTDRGA